MGKPTTPATCNAPATRRGGDASSYDDYVRRLLHRYRRTPGTIGKTRAADRQLAASLYRRGVPLELVENALLMATARRAFRPTDAAPLAPVRSLHYYMSAVDELLANPVDPTYMRYITEKLHSTLATPTATADKHDSSSPQASEEDLSL